MIRGFIPDVSRLWKYTPCTVQKYWEGIGYTLLELFLQEQRTACPSGLVLDFIRHDEHSFCISRIRNSSSRWSPWPARPRLALSVRNRGRSHWFDWDSGMVWRKFFTAVSLLTPPGFIFLLLQRRLKATGWKDTSVVRMDGLRKERRLSWLLASYVMILESLQCITLVYCLRRKVRRYWHNFRDKPYPQDCYGQVLVIMICKNVEI